MMKIWEVAIVLVLVLAAAKAQKNGIPLGGSCEQDSECTDAVDNSFCLKRTQCELGRCHCIHNYFESCGRCLKGEVIAKNGFCNVSFAASISETRGVNHGRQICEGVYTGTTACAKCTRDGIAKCRTTPYGDRLSGAGECDSDAHCTNTDPNSICAKASECAKGVCKCKEYYYRSTSDGKCTAATKIGIGGECKNGDESQICVGAYTEFIRCLPCFCNEYTGYKCRGAGSNIHPTIALLIFPVFYKLFL